MLETFPHEMALAPKEVLLCRFPESAQLTKMRGKIPQISPNFASNHNMLSAIIRNMEDRLIG